jgi:hypothetical protein
MRVEKKRFVSHHTVGVVPRRSQTLFSGIVSISRYTRLCVDMETIPHGSMRRERLARMKMRNLRIRI